MLHYFVNDRKKMFETTDRLFTSYHFIKILFFSCFLFFIPFISKAIITDTLKQDSVETLTKEKKMSTDSLILKPSSFHSPVKATIMSALLPGLGQAYNKKYWKIPIIYAGLLGMGYIVKQQNEKYQHFKNAYISRKDDDPNTVDPYVNKYTDDQLYSAQDIYHRNRDLCIIITAGIYILNIVDANVDANLFYFDVSDNLSLNISPGFETSASKTTVHPSLSLSLNFKFKNK